MHTTPLLLCALVLGAASANVQAIQVCELDGQHVNPANGHTTAGKTGLMRCRDGEGGPVVREQELKNGVFMGVVRHFKDGVLHREHSVNERGNRDGRAREYDGSQLVLEETYRNGKVVGLSKRWHANGQLRRVSFHAEEDREQAVAEFTRQGRLAELRCAPQPQLAPAAVDDAAWCGHQGGPGTVSTYTEDGRLRGKLVHERGERRLSELLWENGRPRERVESTATGGTERSFTDGGTPRRERQWVNVEDGGRMRRSTVLEREYHESGTLVHEKRWAPGPRGSELQSERRWYLNGQPREAVTYTQADGRTLRRDLGFHDNGKLAHASEWLLAGRERQAAGVHKSFDASGLLRLERHHDAKGRLTREREFDGSGQVTRDDELFEDGSRKAYAR